jgi:hypothetical protein
LHVEAILPANVEESEFDDRAEERASEPGTEVKGLSHAVVGDLAKGRERGFSCYGAKARLDSERLQEFGGAHGFGESVDAMRVTLRGEEVEPLVNVITFEKAVGGEVASAGAMSARVGEENAKPCARSS